jgi:trk system potassium uptake protein TrkH
LSQNWPGKAGDRIVRRPRQAELEPITVKYAPRRRSFIQSRAPVMLVLSLAVTMVVGGILLLLPFANTTGTFTPPLVAFFTSISAVSTTGLTLEVTATYWTSFGQAVIFVLMFVGGLGFMTTATFFMIAFGRRLTLPHRLLMRESLLVNELGSLTTLTRNVFLMGIIACFAGTLLLFLPFLHYFGAAEALWQAAFHSVSAFNTAGFDIAGPASLADYRTDYIMLGAMTLIFVIGALSYPVLIDILFRRRFRVYSLNTKLVLLGSLVLWIVGTLAVFASEYRRPDTLGGFSSEDQVFTAFFQRTERLNYYGVRHY